MIILDTNVLSELMQPSPQQRVVFWLDSQPRVSVWTTSITVLEILFGIQILPAGKRRKDLLSGFETILSTIISGRIANFDTAAAQESATLMAARHGSGRPRDFRDAMIAGIVISRRAAIATRNTTHFDDLPVSVFNPWQTDIN
jgi:predicted nucleic acid-binding protein